MLVTSSAVHLPDHEIELSAIRTQDAGGQNTNKISGAVHLRFGIQASSLPPSYKERLLALNGQCASNDGVVVIKAQQYRTQEQNRENTLEYLTELTRGVAKVRKTRRPTKPARGSQKHRLDDRAKCGAVRAEHSKVGF